MHAQIMRRTRHPERVVVTATELAPSDADLSADELEEKYNPGGGGEHPVLLRAHWRHDVASELTIRGYWHWVADVIQEAQLGEVALWH
ncbi:hypothetical protein [Rubrivivax gelatinosus]|uniref:hypothetical protein n=1 Tax=Rubrivivax gelatinosus TaxID=28068 RepID=UPI0005C1C643|nr:hypothetical protein [Rubrivivax gelatinosus]MBG6083089.1 hypothetical protein [Rubrivivax gelatinosus]